MKLSHKIVIGHLVLIAWSLGVGTDLLNAKSPKGSSEEIVVESVAETYEEAKAAPQFISFTMTSIKMALFKSDFTGYMKKFSLKAKKTKNSISEFSLEIPTKEMDTDVGGRNKKMWEHSLRVTQFPQIVVTNIDPIDLTKTNQLIEINVHIFEKDHRIQAQVKISQSGDLITADIEAKTSLSELKIPPPINPLASLEEEIRIQAHFENKLQRE